MHIKRLLAAAALAVTASAAHAVDSVALEYGSGNRSDFVRFSAQWNWQKPLWTSGTTELTGHWDANITRWDQSRYRNIANNSKNFTSIGITPVLRLQRAGSKTGPYAEAGLGAHWFSSIYDNNGRTFSTHYQFGTLLGAGYRFTQNFDLGVRVQHFSNGGFESPNPGINVATVRGAYRF